MFRPLAALAALPGAVDPPTARELTASEAFAELEHFLLPKALTLLRQAAAMPQGTAAGEPMCVFAAAVSVTY